MQVHSNAGPTYGGLERGLTPVFVAPVAGHVAATGVGGRRAVCVAGFNGSWLTSSTAASRVCI